MPVLPSPSPAGPSAAGRLGLLAAALTLVLAVTIGGAGPAAARPAPATPAATTATVPAGAGAAVTLITGDRVLAERRPDGRYEVTVDPAPRADGAGVTFQTIDDGEQLYVLPSDALPLLPDRLDRELFNVTRLAEYGYLDRVPVITTYRGGAPAARSAAAGTATTGTAGTAGITTTAVLDSIGAVAGTVTPDGRWWRSFTTGTGPGTNAGTGVRTAGAGPERVWLDWQVQADLAESVPQVGAPQAWAAGYDGTGVTVAVLDTGIDAGHPDLAGKVRAAENFTDTDSATDRHGHGTHVASTVAGSGAASDGSYTGVAPGATLLNGKVLNDAGNGAVSWIIAGMEWAAAQGAEVINMSLGGPGGNGTDPLSQAVNRLTAEHGVLFAVAAGNSGASDQTIGSPGVADAALTVGAVDKSDVLASRSSRGPRAGDFAIKPDLTAPGVDIVAARADGTALGPIVEEDYTQISGTSMATPHVAGAAAILRQAEPDLTPAALKARLVGSAQPQPGPDVYQQGGGRLDLPAALAAPVTATPTPLNLGYQIWPHEDAEPTTTEITYTNPGDTAVTLDLDLAVRSRGGAVPGPELLSVAPDTLTVPAGGTATAAVTLDASVGELGLYGGYLVATGGGTAVRTPVGFYKEPEQHQLTINAVARDGSPATGLSSVSVLNVDDMSKFFRPAMGFANGQLNLRVPPGTYAVVGAIHTYDANGPQNIQQTTLLGDPELAVVADTTLTLDARDANPLTVQVPERPEARPQAWLGMGFFRTAAVPGPLLGLTYLGLHPDREYFLQPTEPVGIGEFEFYTRWRLAAPEAELAVVEPAPVPLDPVLVRAPAVDGEHTVPLLDLGTGAAEEYAGRDVTGAAVLTRRGLPLAEQEQHAAAAGAAALIVSNDVPGRLFSRPGETGAIPTLTLSQAEGDQLRELLAGGEVTVRLGGTVWSPYVYDLVLVEEAIPEQPEYAIPAADLARLDLAYHNDVPGHQMNEARHFSRPFHSSSALLHPTVVGPRQRAEYVIGGDGLAYRQTVYGEQPFEAQLRQPQPRSYQPGQQFPISFFRQVVRPAAVPEVDLTTRAGDSLNLRLYAWVDSDGNHFPDLFGLAPYPGDTFATRLFRDGELVAEATRPRGNFPMAAEPAEYRVELDVTREADWWRRSVATRTAWTFESQRPADGAAVLPVLSVDYHTDLDLQNTALPARDRRGPPTVELAVRHQAPGLPAVAGARLWVSYDDGESWRPRRVFDRGDGRFEAVLANRGPGTGSGFVSVRVEAWDVAGNRIKQEVIRAWRLPDR